MRYYSCYAAKVGACYCQSALGVTPTSRSSASYKWTSKYPNGSWNHSYPASETTTPAPPSSRGPKLPVLTKRLCRIPRFTSGFRAYPRGAYIDEEGQLGTLGPTRGDSGPSRALRLLPKKHSIEIGTTGPPKARCRSQARPFKEISGLH